MRKYLRLGMRENPLQCVLLLHSRYYDEDIYVLFVMVDGNYNELRIKFKLIM